MTKRKRDGIRIFFSLLFVRRSTTAHGNPTHKLDMNRMNLTNSKQIPTNTNTFMCDSIIAKFTDVFHQQAFSTEFDIGHFITGMDVYVCFCMDCFCSSAMFNLVSLHKYRLPTD